VTLVREPATTCIGMAYQIAAEQVPAVLEHLDYREKNGYERIDAPITFLDEGSDSQSVTALVYIATADNFAHLGPETDELIAAQIAQCSGPSGSNTEYLLELHRALINLGTSDPHVDRLVDLVEQLR